MHDVVRHERRYTVELFTAQNVKKHFPSFLLLGMLRLLAYLPLGVSRVLGAGWGLLVYHVNSKRRCIARINIALCFPELSAHERERLVRRHLIVAGQALFDLGFLAWASLERLQQKTHIVGLEHYRQALKQGRNVILLAPHCVGMSGGSSLAKIHKLFSMVKAQRNPVLNWLLYRTRTRFQGRPVLREQGLRPVIKGIKKNVVFYYLPDEDFGSKRSVFVPFFGVPTATLPTLGRLAASTEALVIPCFTRLLPGTRGYEVRLEPPLTDYPTGDKVADSATMNQVMEQGIRQMPEQYMWTFKLFKTRLDGAPSPYR